MVESNYLQEKALAKVNLTFRILGKETKNYHSINSIVTFLPDLYDNIFIKKNKKLIINTCGEFSKDLLKMRGHYSHKSEYFYSKKSTQYQ